MKRSLALLMAAGGLMAGPANATPKEIPHYVFATMEECEAALYSVWRGNHAFWCTSGADGFVVAYDEAYENSKKGPKNK